MRTQNRFQSYPTETLFIVIHQESNFQLIHRCLSKQFRITTPTNVHSSDTTTNIVFNVYYFFFGIANSKKNLAFTRSGATHRRANGMIDVTHEA